ncbi:MAG: hypothetical protein NXI03_10755 [Alphaproteobacteria bacterium]|uniref:hypothetical protein n=1 Tax=Maricaulis alexandrii TaxID=2570354 RepID=UPI001109D734|nr:hypothetical protein [Maricaulis alexandrii]MCR9268038.1 hypothetical protein [Alphaproteobacteria bacterium]
MMKQDRFFEIIEAYGANPARWPEAEHDAMLAFIDAYPDTVGEALAEAAALDAMMEADEVMPSDLLQRRILKAFPAAPAATPVARPRWQIPVAAAAALLVGVFAGFASGALTASDSTIDDIVYADAFNGLDQDWVDWLGGDV